MNFRHIHHHHDNGGRVLLRFQVSQVSTTFSFEQQHSNVLSPVVVSRRYLSISGKVISGRSRAAPYRSKNEQTSAKLGQSAGPELRTTTEAAIFPGGEKQEGRGCCQDATVYAIERSTEGRTSTSVKLDGSRVGYFRVRFTK